MKKKIGFIASILLVCAFLLTACGVPEGYRDYGIQLIDYDGSGYGTFFLDSQFSNENSSFSELAVDKLYFSYNETLYYVAGSGGEEFYEFRLCGNYSVYKDDGKEQIGAFVFIEKNKNTKMIAIYDAIFLSEKYLYYGFKKCLDKKKFVISPDGFALTHTYYKNEFYRFDLDTGENESVSLGVFFEKLQAVDSTATLND